MTDLIHVLPEFSISQYAHLIPSLERCLITTTDLLTLDAVEVSKRAKLPTVDVRQLIRDVTVALQLDLGLEPGEGGGKAVTSYQARAGPLSLRRDGNDLNSQTSFISTLDSDLDEALRGGIPTGYITEITGESGAGKTQLLLTLLLSAQLPSPQGLSRPTLYISTEHPLPTTRLRQMISSHPLIAESASPPALSQVLTLQVPDLETQDHVLTYQVPIGVRAKNIGLVVIDSIAANYRAEATSLSGDKDGTPSRTGVSALAARAADLARTGALLRKLARETNCAIVVSNQVADRFSVSSQQANAASQGSIWNSSPAMEPPRPTQGFAAPDQELRQGWAVHPALSLDFQQRFFTGWGTEGGHVGGVDEEKAKTPALGLVWTNQIACRVALIKEAAWTKVPPPSITPEHSAEWKPRKWRRWARVTFAPWARGTPIGQKGVEFEIWSGGIRTRNSTREPGENDGKNVQVYS